MPPNASIIDIAAGANNGDFYPEGFGHSKVTAVDVSRTALELNQSGIRLNHDVRFPLTPLHLAPFDFGVSCFGFRYFENQAQVVGHILEILKPGGRFAVVDFVDYEHDDMVRKFEIETLRAETISHPQIKHIEEVNIMPEAFARCKIDGIIFQKIGSNVIR